MGIGITLGAVSVIIAVVLGVPPLWREHRRSRTHVRQLWVRLERRWDPVGEDHRQRVLTGTRLVVRNAGQHPVWDVIVRKPEPLATTEFKSVGPGEVLELEVPQTAVTAGGDESVTVQVTDNHGRVWVWTPLKQELRRPGSKITPLALIVQATSHCWPQSWHDRFARLPKRAQRFLWGSDPAGEDPDAARP